MTVAEFLTELPNWNGINGIFEDEEELPEISSDCKVMAMKRRYWVPLLVAAVAIASLGVWRALAPDTFLNQKVDRTQTFPYCGGRIGSYLNRLEAIQPVVGKKVIFPPGLIEYATQEKLGMPELIWFGGQIAWYQRFTIRDYLNDMRVIVGLNWRYDAAQDAVVFDFAWHRPVTHSGEELVNQIGELSPAPSTSLGWYGHQLELDPWRQDLDELMSEPGNFPHTWKARLQDCCSDLGSMTDSIGFGDNIYSHILKDADEKDHLLVLHSHHPLSNKGPGWTFTYYLFAADGKWEDAGIFEMDIWPPPAVLFTTVNVLAPDGKIQSGNVRAVIVTNPKSMQTTDYPAKDYPGGNALDYLLEINHGKLTASLYKDGMPLNPMKYTEVNVTPLRHLGD